MKFEFSKFAGVGPDQIVNVVDSLTDAEVLDLYDHWVSPVAHYVIDEFADPLGLPPEVDGMTVVCRLYRRYMGVAL